MDALPVPYLICSAKETSPAPLRPQTSGKLPNFSLKRCETHRNSYHVPNGVDAIKGGVSRFAQRVQPRRWVG